MSATDDLFSNVLANANVMVGLCADVYGSPVDVESVPRDTQVNVRVVTTSLGASLVVAFRGTCDAKGWQEDAEVSRQAIEGSMVHRGFMADVMAVLPEVEKGLDQHIGSPLFVTGHSKGGAEAMLMAWVLRNRGRVVDGVYTFGQPRVGDESFAVTYDRALGFNTWRFTHGADIVPWVPWLLGRYRHAGNEVYMPEGNIFGAVPSPTYVINPSTLYKLSCDGRQTWKALRTFGKGGIPQTEDHHIQQYVDAVAATLR